MTLIRFFVIAFFLTLLGCAESGPTLGYVTGVVTLNGSPLPNAEVMFDPEKGSPSYGTTDENGFYELGYTIDKKGAMVGKHTVKIETWKIVTEEDGKKREVPELVPPEYNTKSNITREVVEGDQTFNFNIP